MRVGTGTGPHTRALVRLAWSTISFADASSARWSYASIRVRIRSPCGISSTVLSRFFTSNGATTPPLGPKWTEGRIYRLNRPCQHPQYAISISLSPTHLRRKAFEDRYHMLKHATHPTSYQLRQSTY